MGENVSRADGIGNQPGVCREVTKGVEVLARMEEVETVTQGIFVMPKARVHIHSTYVYEADSPSDAPKSCRQELRRLQERFHAQSKRLEQIRSTRLP